MSHELSEGMDLCMQKWKVPTIRACVNDVGQIPEQANVSPQFSNLNHKLWSLFWDQDINASLILGIYICLLHNMPQTKF